MNARVVTDARRWAAFRSVGAYQLLLEIHASLEDAAGAIDAGQALTAAQCARSVVMRTLGVLSIEQAGDLALTEDDPAFDPFAGLPADEVADALRLAAAFVEDLAEAAQRSCFEHLTQFVRDAERRLGFSTPPPSVRGPRGLFPAIRVARELVVMADAALLPPALPAEWRNAAGQRDGGGTSR